MKKKIYIFIIIIIIFIFVILSTYKTKINLIDDILIFSLLEQNEYVIDYKKDKKIKIDVFQTVQNNSNREHKKIAPGSCGKIIIKLIKPKELNCNIFIKDITRKPQNVIFELNGHRCKYINDLEKEINNMLEKEDLIEICWKWEYDINKEADIQDTIDGQKAEKYIFEISAIINQE